MAISRLQIAKADILKHFESLSSKVFRTREIAAVLAEQRGFWRLAQNTRTEAFIQFLTESGKLQKVSFGFPGRPVECYTWGDVPLMQAALHVSPGAYFSHYTAMRVHGLTEQVPKTVYLSAERASPTPHTVLSQQQITDSLSRPPRVSNNFADLQGRRFYLLNGEHTKNLGVFSQPLSDDGATFIGRVTDLERTLIDITVRPFYAGGVFEVAKAYEQARPDVSINKLVAMLKRLNFSYPVHQAVGCYAERAGYKPTQLDLLRRLPMVNDFYLSHAMVGARLCQPWRIYVPDGF